MTQWSCGFPGTIQVSGAPMTLAPLDWIIILIYVVGCLSAGLWMRRYVHNVDEFSVAGRELHVNLGITSLAATELGLVTIMYTAQLGYEKGFAGAAPGVLMCLSMLLIGYSGFVIRPLRDAGVMTIPELFEKRFSARVRWTAGLFVALGGLLNMGIFLRLGGDFLVNATGMPQSYLKGVMSALLALVLTYTAFGGMLSVLITDYIQFLVVGTGMVVTSVIVLHTVGWHSLIAGMRAAWVAGQTRGSAAAAHPFNPFHPSNYGWGYLAWQCMFQIAVVTTWQTMISRVLSTKDSKVATQMYQRTAFYYVGRFLIPALWGAGALVFFRAHGGLPAGLDSMTAMPTKIRRVRSSCWRGGSGRPRQGMMRSL